MKTSLIATGLLAATLALGATASEAHAYYTGGVRLSPFLGDVMSIDYDLTKSASLNSDDYVGDSLKKLTDLGVHANAQAGVEAYARIAKASMYGGHIAIGADASFRAFANVGTLAAVDERVSAWVEAGYYRQSKMIRCLSCGPYLPYRTVVQLRDFTGALIGPSRTDLFADAPTLDVPLEMILIDPRSDGDRKVSIDAGFTTVDVSMELSAAMRGALHGDVNPTGGHATFDGSTSMSLKGSGSTHGISVSAALYGLDDAPGARASHLHSEASLELTRTGRGTSGFGMCGKAFATVDVTNAFQADLFGTFGGFSKHLGLGEETRTSPVCIDLL